MCDNQSKMQALVQQWRYFNDLISQIEGQFLTAPLAVLTVIAAGRIYASGPDSGGLTLISELTIAVSSAVTAYLAFQIRKVAVIRGYIRRIERELNAAFGISCFDWSIHCASNYLGNCWMNYLLPASLGAAFLVACAAAVQTIVSSQGFTTFVVLLFILCAVVVGLSVYSLFYNGRVSEMVSDGKRVGTWFPWDRSDGRPSK